MKLTDREIAELATSIANKPVEINGLQLRAPIFNEDVETKNFIANVNAFVESATGISTKTGKNLVEAKKAEKSLTEDKNQRTEEQILESAEKREKDLVRKSALARKAKQLLAEGKRSEAEAIVEQLKEMINVNTYSFKDKDSQIDELARFLDLMGKERHDYETTSEDAGDNYVYAATEDADVEGINDRDLKKVAQKIVKSGVDEDKVIEWMKKNGKQESGDMHIPSGGAWGMPVGEVEEQVSHVAGIVNGKKVQDVFEALKKGLDKDELEKAGRNLNECYWDGEGDTVSVSTDSYWWLIVDEEALAKAFNVKMEDMSSDDMDEVSRDMHPADRHQKKIAMDTVKNPDKALLGGMSAEEAEMILKKKFKMSDEEIQKLKEMDEAYPVKQRPGEEDKTAPSKHDTPADKKFKELMQQRDGGDANLKGKTDMDLAKMAGIKMMKPGYPGMKEAASDKGMVGKIKVSYSPTAKNHDTQSFMAEPKDMSLEQFQKMIAGLKGVELTRENGSTMIYDAPDMDAASDVQDLAKELGMNDEHKGKIMRIMAQVHPMKEDSCGSDEEPMEGAEPGAKKGSVLADREKFFAKVGKKKV